MATPVCKSSLGMQSWLVNALDSNALDSNMALEIYLIAPSEVTHGPVHRNVVHGLDQIGIQPPTSPRIRVLPDEGSSVAMSEDE